MIFLSTAKSNFKYEDENLEERKSFLRKEGSYDPP
jgi:hypothetical protein